MTMSQTPSTRPTLQNSKTPATMCSEAGCSNVAAFSYVWPWGEAGACCHSHRLHVQQRAENLGRGAVHMTAIDPHYVAPITRDERTQLLAARMSAEQETKDALARGAELYALNTRANQECQRLRTRNEEAEAQLGDARSQIDTLIGQRNEALASAGAAQREVERLKALLPTNPKPLG